VKRAETGELLLNPPRDLVLAIDDDVLFLAEDDDTYQPTPLVLRSMYSLLYDVGK